MKAVLADFVEVLNERRTRGEMRAVPYASRWAAERVGLDDRRVRDAVASLVKTGVLVKRGAMGGTPLYALRVRALWEADVTNTQPKEVAR